MKISEFRELMTQKGMSEQDVDALILFANLVCPTVDRIDFTLHSIYMLFLSVSEDEKMVAMEIIRGKIK